MKTITIAKGDGIGPEIMDATLNIIKASGAEIGWDEIQVGEKVYLEGNKSGISNSSWDTIRKNKILFKAPITTPQGGGYKSLNVTIRKTLGLYSNVRPCVSYFPFVQTKHAKMDVIIVRENEEDLYAGIEHQQTDEVVQCLKLISRPGCEKIVRYAFELAMVQNRKKVTCFSKDNIMKQTDGLFHQVFKEIASEYPSIKTDHMIIDIGAAKLADTPEQFDVIVTSNLYGDIISDIAAQVAGSVGLAGSANIGESCAMFEAIHGSAPDIAGKNLANPSGLIQAAVMMLNHLGLNESATKIQNAWLKTIEEGYHTADIYNEMSSRQKMTTSEFGEKVISFLGQKPSQLQEANFPKSNGIQLPKYVRKNPSIKVLKGVDLFVHWTEGSVDMLAKRIQTSISKSSAQLQLITNRGIKVWPGGFEETFCTDHWRCRFFIDEESRDNAPIIDLLHKVNEEGLDVIKTENLYEINGKDAFSVGQGQ